jgi:hypothetical protein
MLDERSNPGTAHPKSLVVLAAGGGLREEQVRRLKFPFGFILLISNGMQEVVNAGRNL